MTDRLALAPAIAARTEPRFIEIKPEPRTKLRRTNDRTFIEIPPECGGGRVPFTEEQLTARRGGLSAEEYRWKMIRKWGKRFAWRKIKTPAQELPGFSMSAGSSASGETTLFRSTYFLLSGMFRYF